MLISPAYLFGIRKLIMHSLSVKKNITDLQRQTVDSDSAMCFLATLLHPVAHIVAASFMEGFGGTM